MPLRASPKGPAVRALVVDDHPLIQEAVRNVLRRLEPQAVIDVAGDCERGLDLAGDGTEPDLVLLDLNLPGLSGIPALKMWRRRYPGIPVVILSAATDQQTVLAAIGASALTGIGACFCGWVMGRGVSATDGVAESMKKPRSDATLLGNH